VFADPTDVSLLIPKLTTLKEKHDVEFDLFTHLDFMWAMQANTLVYDYITAVLP